MKQSRWTSPIAISAIAALIFFVVRNWVGFEIPGWDQFITLVLACGIAFGVFNDPTNKTGF